MSLLSIRMTRREGSERQSESSQKISSNTISIRPVSRRNGSKKSFLVRGRQSCESQMWGAYFGKFRHEEALMLEIYSSPSQSNMQNILLFRMLRVSASSFSHMGVLRRMRRRNSSNASVRRSTLGTRWNINWSIFPQFIRCSWIPSGRRT